MNIAKSYLNDKQRLDLISDYITHEKKKSYKKLDEVFSTIDKNTGSQYAELSVKFFENNDVPTTSLIDYWKLFHGLSYGLFRKELWNCVGVPHLRWEKSKLKDFKNLCLETPQSWLADEIENSSEPLPITEARKLIENKSQVSPEILQHSIENYRKLSKDPRETDPIIGTFESNRIKINDGNGRLQMWLELEAIGEQVDSSKLMIWVGRPGRNPSLIDAKVFTFAQKELFVTKN